MNATQIYTIVNSLAEQSLGMTGLTATDASFISVGKEVLATDKNTEQFYKTLADRIGKTVFAIREYRNKNKALLAEGVEFGIALQKITFDLLTAKESKTWTGMETNPFEVFNSNVKQSIFSVMSVWEFDLTVWDRQLRTAFINAQNMGAFINGLMTAFYNSMELAEENLGNIAKASLIARKKEKAINLLHEYNTLTNAGLTVGKCLTDKDFLKFASMTISMYSDRLTSMSKLFNDGSVAKHTPKENQSLTVLNDFAKACSYFMESDTYFKDLVALPKYNVTNFWQSSGATYAFSDISAINVDLASGTNVTMSGIVALLADDEAVKITVQDKRITSSYNPRGEYTNYFAKGEKGFINALDENAIVFYVAEA